MYNEFKDHLTQDFPYEYEEHFAGGTIPRILADDEEWDEVKIAMNASLHELERRFIDKQKLIAGFGLPLPDFKHEKFYRFIFGDEKDTTITGEKARRFSDKNF